MKRRYNPEMYQRVVQRINTTIPDAAIGIDVIVGFPGETEAAFEETVAFLTQLPWSYLHVFTYSERADTPALDYPGVVQRNVRRARTHRLRALSDVRRREHYARNIGTTRIFLPEHYDHDLGGWFGWTENYVRVLHKTHQLIKLGPHAITVHSLENDYTISI
jgi:threonylcarbamoyladenosine tRNA methylthiotransferase MtaB